MKKCNVFPWLLCCNKWPQLCKNLWPKSFSVYRIYIFIITINKSNFGWNLSLRFIYLLLISVLSKVLSVLLNIVLIFCIFHVCGRTLCCYLCFKQIIGSFHLFSTLFSTFIMSWIFLLQCNFTKITDKSFLKWWLI